MNRDDAATRREAGPTLRRAHGVLMAAPTDLQAGGAWVAVNEYGVIACLLNRYDSARAGRVSRGGIVIEALGASDTEQAAARIVALTHNDYAPFTCVIISAVAARRIDWTGAHLTQRAIGTLGPWMMTSSSWRLDEVRRRREELFVKSWADAQRPTEPLSEFHCRRDALHDAWAPMMLRETAQTKSIVQVDISSGGAEMRYWRRQSAITRGLCAADHTVRMPIVAQSAQSPPVGPVRREARRVSPL